MIQRKHLLYIGILGLLVAFAPGIVYGYYYSQGTANTNEFITSVSTDKDSYSGGETITISGEVNQYDEKRDLQIVIRDPSKRIFLMERDVPVESDGTFSLTIDSADFEKKGVYTIRAMYGTKDYKVGTSSFSFDPGMVSSEMKNVPPHSVLNIPAWIRNNAGWWAAGSISDSDFVGGIQFMIKENIMVIPYLPEDTQMELKDEKRAMGLEREQQVPDWVRNNAGWWADGLISDDDFVSGIKYLVEQGIIRV